MEIALRLSGDKAATAGAPCTRSEPLRKSAQAVIPVATTLTTLDDIEEIELAWRRLERAARGAVFFQSFNWCHLVWRTKPQISARIVVVGPLNAPLAIWPLRVERTPLGRFVHDLSDPFGQYSDILFSAGADRSVVFDAALREVQRWHVDGLILRRVREETHLHGLLSEKGAIIVETLAAPAISLANFDSFDTYHKSISSKTRKNLRNYRNRIDRLGTLEHVVSHEPQACADVIKRCFSMRTMWLLERGQSSVAFADNAFADIMRHLAKAHRFQPDTRTMQLRVASETENGTSSKSIDGTCVSELSLHLGFVHNDIYYAYMAAKNPSFDHLSPGRVHLLALIEACGDREIKTVDLLPPDMPYKQNFATDTTIVHGLALPLTLRGRFFIEAWQHYLRPMMKSVFAMLPTQMRRTLMHLLRIG